MPTYEYQCEACGNRFEKFQSITAAPIKKCPKCGKKKVKRLMGRGGAIIFKGSGFYTTDYRDKSYTDRAKADSGGDKTPEKTGEKTGEKSGEQEAGKSSEKTGTEN